MLIKRKSLIVALVSGVVISLVLILTLIGCFVYIEFKAEEFKRTYQELLRKAKAVVYSKHLEISGLDARIEYTGPLKGKPVIEGTVANKGSRAVTELTLKINFTDKDNAVIYETILRPQEPSLGSSGLAPISIPYLYTPPKTALKPKEALRFKKILAGCPTEIFMELRDSDKPKKSFGKWSGSLTSQVVSLDF